MPAQGNALGNKDTTDVQALKGRDKGLQLISPFQGWDFTAASGSQGVALG